VTVRPLASATTPGFVVVLYDVTQLRRLESVRRDFVANVSHELRTPVATIQGYAETLLRGTADAATSREFLEAIHRHARRIGRLVADLLRLAEIEARPSEANGRVPVAITDVVSSAAETMHARALEARVTITRDVAPDLVALGDPEGLERILENLLDNAIKYGRPGGRVVIESRRHGARVHLVVADDGPGIAPEHLGRIFERFYRVDAGRSRELGGSGLGLAIVKRLVHSMGGSIVAESEAGRGTRFVIDLAAA
jgi:two-component system phosphate regulon sensor histidine kinase PhoR